jgi:hypothetical protein
MFSDEINQSIDRLHFRNIELQRLLADIQIDLSGSSAYITEIRVGHFAWSVYDATHYRDLYPFQVVRGGLDASSRCLQVKERTPARRTGYVIGFEDSGARPLEDVIGQTK